MGAKAAVDSTEKPVVAEIVAEAVVVAVAAVLVGEQIVRRVVFGMDLVERSGWKC